jgi:hypothetical protein
MNEQIHSNDAFRLGTAGTLPAEQAPVYLDPLHGFAQALASIALGMTFVGGGPATMILIWVLFDGHFRDFSRLDKVLVAICGFLGMLMILTAAVFGLIFGVQAILAARRHNRPTSLGVAGVILNGFCLPLWIFIGILWAFAVGTRI